MSRLTLGCREWRRWVWGGPDFSSCQGGTPSSVPLLVPWFEWRVIFFHRVGTARRSDPLARAEFSNGGPCPPDWTVTHPIPHGEPGFSLAIGPGVRYSLVIARSGPRCPTS